MVRCSRSVNADTSRTNRWISSTCVPGGGAGVTVCPTYADNDAAVGPVPVPSAWLNTCGQTRRTDEWSSVRGRPREIVNDDHPEFPALLTEWEQTTARTSAWQDTVRGKRPEYNHAHGCFNQILEIGF